MQTLPVMGALTIEKKQMKIITFIILLTMVSVVSPGYHPCQSHCIGVDDTVMNEGGGYGGADLF